MRAVDIMFSQPRIRVEGGTWGGGVGSGQEEESEEDQKEIILIPVPVSHPAPFCPPGLWGTEATGKDQGPVSTWWLAVRLG